MHSNDGDPERRMVFYVNLKTRRAQWTPPTSPAQSRNESPEPHDTGHHAPDSLDAALDNRNVALDEVHRQSSEPHKTNWAGKLNNSITGAERGFKSGLRGRYGDGGPSNQSDWYANTGRRNRRGGELISAVIGGVIGGVQGNKYPVQESNAGMRPSSVGKSENSIGHGQANFGGHSQQTDVYTPEYTTETGVHSDQHLPPQYEPRGSQQHHENHP
jgi:hypothetical protein